MAARPRNWLHGLVCANNSVRYPWQREVFPLVLKDRTWSAVSDGKGVLAVDEGGHFVTCQSPGEGYEAISPTFQRAISGQPRRVRNLKLIDLLSWLPGPDSNADNPPVGVISGLHIDTALLRWFLCDELLESDTLTAPGCRVGSASPTGDPKHRPYAILVIAKRWRLFLMSMERDDGPHPIYLPQLGELWGARHTPVGRERIADFYAEHDEPEYAEHVRAHPFRW